MIILLRTNHFIHTGYHHRISSEDYPQQEISKRQKEYGLDPFTLAGALGFDGSTNEGAPTNCLNSLLNEVISPILDGKKPQHACTSLQIPGDFGLMDVAFQVSYWPESNPWDLWGECCGIEPLMDWSDEII